MQGSRSSFFGAWARLSVLTFFSSARWIGPSGLATWTRTTDSSVGSVNVTVDSLVQVTSFFGRGGSGALAGRADADGALALEATAGVADLAGSFVGAVFGSSQAVVSAAR